MALRNCHDQARDPVSCFLHRVSLGAKAPCDNTHNPRLGVNNQDATVAVFRAQREPHQPELAYATGLQIQEPADSRRRLARVLSSP